MKKGKTSDPVQTNHGIDEAEIDIVVDASRMEIIRLLGTYDGVAKNIRRVKKLVDVIERLSGLSPLGADEMNENDQEIPFRSVTGSPRVWRPSGADSPMHEVIELMRPIVQAQENQHMSAAKCRIASTILLDPNVTEEGKRRARELILEAQELAETTSRQQDEQPVALISGTGEGEEP